MMSLHLFSHSRHVIHQYYQKKRARNGPLRDAICHMLKVRFTAVIFHSLSSVKQVVREPI